MNLTEAKEKAQAALNDAEAALGKYGVKLTAELEVAENEISENESEALMLLGTLALTTDDLTEDDVYYLSFEAKVSDNTVDEAELGAAVAEFSDKVNAVADRLNMGPDATTVIKALDKEVDEQIEAEYRAAVDAAHRAVKREMKVIIFAIVLLAVVAIASAVIAALPK